MLCVYRKLMGSRVDRRISSLLSDFSTYCIFYKNSLGMSIS